MKAARLFTVVIFAALTAVFPAAVGAAASAPTAGYVENVTFEKPPLKERVTFHLSAGSAVTAEYREPSSVVVKMENLFVPEELRRPLSESSLLNVRRVTLSQQAGGGRAWVLAAIELNRKVPYSLRQEGNKVLVDFNVASLSAAPAAGPTQGPPQSQESGKVYTGQRIFLDVQEADIKAVFRLLAEQGRVSIVSGDDVKGTVTLHMRDVPWDQALDTILELKGLEKRQEGNIITVISLERKKKEEADRIAMEEARRKAEDERKARQQKQNVEQGRLRQIAIEAKIVEVSTNFARDLGIRWGYGYRDTWQGRDIGLLIGSSASGTLTSLPTGIGLTKSNIAVNFPAVSGADATLPGIGLLMGSSKFILDAKLSALESSGDGRIISSPKVTTLENEKATIWQGKKVPVVTPATSTSPATVRYEDADLRLIVTPKITQEQNRISLEIDAVNRDIDRSYEVMGNPLINTSGVTSRIVVRDGDTVVVGGVYKMVETAGVSGVPFLSEIPILGWLFKTETKTKDTRELLVFITPRIIPETR